MTAVNIFVQPGSVHLFTDTKAGITGTHAALQAVKCVALPFASAAIATRGAWDVLPLLHKLASQFESYADLKANLIREAKAYRDQAVVPSEREALRSDWDAFVIGWGEDGPEAFGFFSHALHGITPWLLFPIELVCVTPTLPQPLLEKVLESDDLLWKGMAILDLQLHSYPESIGGHMVETWVDSIGVHTRQLMKFPDIAVKPAVPTRGVKLPKAFARYQTSPVPNDHEGV